MNWGIMEIIEATGATPDRLPKRLPVLTGISTDSRTVRKGELFVALKGPTHDGHQFVGAALARGARAILAQDPISVERKVPCLFVPDTLHAYGALASSYRKRLRVRLSAITGSMGKTTTKEMAATILARKYKVAKTRENENNRVGVPKTLLSIEPDTDVAVIELGSNIPGEISLLAGIVGADRALVTNIAPVHLERFKTLEGVRIEKSALFWASPKETLRCINRDDPHIRKIPLKPEWPTLTYGTGKSSQVRATHVKPLGLEGIQFTLTAAGENIDISLPLLGTHQVKNALAAATLGILEGISLAEIKEALASFRAPGKRLEAISTASGPVILNDTYNASPEATRMALETLAMFDTSYFTIALLGDMLELGEETAAYHEEIGAACAKNNLGLLGLTGAYRDSTRKGAIRHGFDKGKIFFFDDEDSLLKNLAPHLNKSAMILVKGSRALKMERWIEVILSKTGKRGGKA